MEALLSPYAQRFPPRIQSVYIQAVPKVFSAWSIEILSIWTHERKVEVEFIIEQIILWMDTFRYSTDLEVQERAVGFHQIFLRIQHEINETSIPESRQYQDEATESWGFSRPQTQFPCLSELTVLFGDIELNPVGAKAQRKVPIPEGLDLETPLYTTQQYISWPDDNLEEDEVPKSRVTVDPVTSERRRQEHLDRVRDDPFYILGDNRRPISRADTPISGEEDFDSIPIVQFDGGTNLLTPVGSTKVRKKRRKPREIVLDEPPVDIAVDEMPEDAALSDTEVNRRKEVKKTGKNVLSNEQAKGLEAIDFEEEERLEREAIEADRIARENPSQNINTMEIVEEPVVVERVRKKKKKERSGEGTKKVKKKKTESA